MPKKKSNRKDNLSPIERLFSGDVGPLPVDNDLQEATPESTSGETQSLASDVHSGDFSETLLGNVLRNHPGLTPEKAQKMIDAFG